MSQEKQQRDQTKLLLIGDANTGKTSSVQAMLKKDFPTKYEITQGLNYQDTSVKGTDQKDVNLRVWDTTGQARFRKIITS